MFRKFAVEWFGYRGCWWVHPFLDFYSVGIDGKIPFTQRGITKGWKWN